MAPKKDDPINVTIDVSHIRYELQDMVKRQIQEVVKEHLIDMIAAEVSKVAEDVARVDIKKQMRDLIEDGWQKTDSYGRPDGKKVTVKDLVLEYMNAHDRYDSRGTWMQKTLQSLLTETLQKVVAPEIEAARKAFKDMLDTSIREKLTNALREAMGLKL